MCYLPGVHRKANGNNKKRPQIGTPPAAPTGPRGAILAQPELVQGPATAACLWPGPTSSGSVSLQAGHSLFRPLSHCEVGPSPRTPHRPGVTNPSSANHKPQKGRAHLSTQQVPTKCSQPENVPWSSPRQDKGDTPTGRNRACISGPLTSAGTRVSGGSPRWVSWTRPRSPHTAPRTEPGAGNGERHSL